MKTLLALAWAAGVLAAAEPEIPRGWTRLGTNRQGLEELENGKDGSVLIRVPAGEFVMGCAYEMSRPDERPAHRVSLSAYAIGRCEVTRKQYERFCAATGRELPHKLEELPKDRPITNVTWPEAVAYCAWAGVRLPTEAEWERAARGVDGRRYPWGNEEPTLKLAALGDSFLASMQVGVSPVGARKEGASPVGAFDMAGNVWEYCQDWYDARSYELQGAGRNPVGPASGVHRVIRGGSWGSVPERLRCTARDREWPEARSRHVGFRVAR